MFFLILSLNSGFCYGLFCDPGPDLVTAGFFEKFRTAYAKHSEYFDNKVIQEVVSVNNLDEVIGFSVCNPCRNLQNDEHISVIVMPKETGKFRVGVYQYLPNCKYPEKISCNEVTANEANKIINKYCFSSCYWAMTKSKILNAVEMGNRNNETH